MSKNTPELAEETTAKHLKGNLYAISNNVLMFAEMDEEITSDLKFSNPRLRLVNGMPTGKGFSKEEMDELRESIRTQGLLHPLIAWSKGENIGEQRMPVVNGERRLRCIHKLIADDAQCFDNATATFRPASEIYQMIECRVLTNPDIKTIYKHAFSSNENAKDIGEGATVALIKRWRKSGWDDATILEVTGKSITWLRDTDALIGLDDVTFTALQKEDINRTVALRLAEIDDVGERQKRLAKTREFAALRIAALQEKVEQELEAVTAAAELAEAQVADAEALGRKGMKNQAQIRAAKIQRKLERKQTAVNNALEKEAKVTSKDLDLANKELVSDINKRLTYSKLEKHWYGDCVAAIKNKSAKHGNVDVDLEDVRLVKYLWEHGIEKDERSIMKLLAEHAELKAARSRK